MPDSVLEEHIVQVKDGTIVRALWPLIRPYFWMLCLSTLLVFIVTAFELLMPLLTQRAIDGFIVPVSPEKGITLLGLSFESFSTFCLFFAGVVCAAFIIDFLQSIFMEYTGQKIILNLRCILFSHMTFLPVKYFDKNSSGRLVSRVTSDIENMNEMFTSILIFIFKDLFFMAGILLILFFLNPWLAGCMIFLVPVIVVSITVFSKVIRTTFRIIRQKIAEITHSFSEAITGIKIIQATDSQHRFSRQFKALNLSHYAAALHQIRIFAVFMPFIGFLGVLSTAIIIWAGSFKVMEQTLTLGELVAFLTYMKLFFRPLRELSEKFNLLQSALASAERVIAILKTGKARQRTATARNTISTIETIRFDQVCFSYDGETQVLTDISFFLPKGEAIGIVGRTGSGKSSIINLITGFYTQDTGRIMINGMDAASINVRDIRSRTALVMQEPVLFSGTIRDNICPYGSQIADQVLETALKNAHCGFLFEKFSGLDTVIKEGGQPLSSGEKQLVCIARAFAFNPDLIIFDEATSYMDSQSETSVHDAMKKLMKGRLTIIIAHRLSTVRNCNTILLLRDGMIREKGSHRQLVKSKGEYYYLLKKEKIQ